MRLKIGKPLEPNSTPKPPIVDVAVAGKPIRRDDFGHGLAGLKTAAAGNSPDKEVTLQTPGVAAKSFSDKTSQPIDNEPRIRDTGSLQRRE